jgi:hypothetical protein
MKYLMITLAGGAVAWLLRAEIGDLWRCAVGEPGTEFVFDEEDDEGVGPVE